ncbi:hypothetical protein LSCM1_04891 [Leishmania martiniquensis]|uniref:Cation/H+ exchanger transmembrane domain-containing protein n=1 Tax=Leishmania martiniquensis TaxID=1580590 RepID=A0A836H013_9TRYP|nr:hypothetical protein LSCM1_04891 [Leishmania martiniquensis]
MRGAFDNNAQQQQQYGVPEHDNRNGARGIINDPIGDVELRSLKLPSSANGASMPSHSNREVFAVRSRPRQEGGADGSHSSSVTSPFRHPSHHNASDGDGSVFVEPSSSSSTPSKKPHEDEVVLAEPFVPEKADPAAAAFPAQATGSTCRSFTSLQGPRGLDDVTQGTSEDSYCGPVAKQSTPRGVCGSQPQAPVSAGQHDRTSPPGSLGASFRFSDSFIKQAYVKELPPHLMPLAHEIHHLDEEDLVYIADVTHMMANRDLYSLLPYTGSNWFLPSIRECGEGEKHWEVRWCWKEGFIVAIGGRRLSIRLLNILIRVCFLALLWFLLWNMLPRWLVEPGGYVWDPAVLVIVSAILGGLICRILQLPPLVGVLWVGIMWNNIPTLKWLTHGIVKEVYDICSKLGLTVILARAGYKLAIKDIIPHWKQTALLATIPFVLEGVSHSLIANKIFNYNDDYNWAFLQGMLCSIVSPAVVVPGCLYLQDLGYGCGVGPLSLMLSAVGIEIVVGVWCANFLIGLIFNDQKLAVAIVLGPVQFAGGILIGIGLGILFFYVVELIKQEAHRLPNGKYTRAHLNSCMDFAFMIFLFGCYTMVFFGYKMSLAGGGCVMCVFFSATVAHMWSRTGKVEHEDHKKYVATWLAFTWDQLMMPILFATMGAKIDVKAIFNRTFFPRALICMVCSTAVRFTSTLLIQIGSGMPWKEKLLVCVGYLGKASAQASVGPIAANLVENMIATLPEDQKHSLDTMAEYANNVQQISAMYVMFMAVVASLGLVRGGTLVLKREQTAKAAKENRVIRSSSGALLPLPSP